MVAVCKEWFRLEGYFNPLCGQIFNPVEGQPSCPACIQPLTNFGNCSGIDGCATMQVPRYIILDLGVTLTEASHVYPTTGGSGLNFFDKYPTAAEIGAPCTLSALSWNAGKENTTCTWLYTEAHLRHFKRVGFSKPPNATNYQTLVITDDTPTSPYSCSGLNEQCSTSYWSFIWKFQIMMSGGRATAFLTITRNVCRHVEAPIGWSSSPLDGPFYWTPANSSPITGPITNVPMVPSIHGLASGGGSGAFAQLAGQPSIANYPTIAGWKYDIENLCSQPSPWTLTKVWDLYEDLGFNSITNFPETVTLEIGT